AELLRITHLLKKTPDQLSGGEKQRVALARGLTKKTDLYVFDDPLSGLDFKLREQLIDDLQRLQKSLGATFVYTTSDSLEALMLAQQVYILYGGKTVEAGALEKVYSDPGHIKSMELLGFPSANVMEGTISSRSGTLWCKTSLFQFPVDAGDQSKLREGQKVRVGIRPQKIQPFHNIKKGVSFTARIVLREDLGGESVVHLEAEQTSLLSVLRQEDVHLLTKDEMDFRISPASILIFSSEDGQRIAQGGGDA
ncbi:MAG: ATP-binding cassette domain-containing protein, partial [Spirochaetota bacterium]